MPDRVGIQEDLSVMRPLRKTMRMEGSVPGTWEQTREAVGLWGRVTVLGMISLGMATAGRGTAILGKGGLRCNILVSEMNAVCYCQNVSNSRFSESGSILVQTGSQVFGVL